VEPDTTKKTGRNLKSLMSKMLILRNMTTSLTGGWSAYHTNLSVEELDVFKKALNGLVGVSYTPLAVAHQVVSGTNYSFFCNAKGVYPDALNEAAVIHIYKPLSGDAHITTIHKV